MAAKQQKPPFWRRNKPLPKYDIVRLRPKTKSKGKRFETPQDARAESERSEKLLLSFSRGSKIIGEPLQDCRAGDYQCNETFCPICGRIFRRWFIGQLLRVTKGCDQVHISTVLLKEATTDKINELKPAPLRHVLRKRLQRSGLANVPVIGGFEIVYKAKRRTWVLHANLVVIGGDKSARKKFKQSFKVGELERPVMWVRLKDRPEQLSYILKFSTYHRPHEQHGSRKSEAKSLNPKQHAALLNWMSQFDFADFLLLINARRKGGTRIVLSSSPAAKN